MAQRRLTSRCSKDNVSEGSRLMLPILALQATPHRIRRHPKCDRRMAMPEEETRSVMLSSCN